MSDDVQKWCDLGAQHLEQGEPEEALHWYERAIDADPSNADAWCGRAKSQYDMGRLERADKDYRHAMHLGRDHLELSEDKGPRRWWADPATRPYLNALRGRGLCRYWLGDWPGSIRYFQRLLQLAPADPLDARYMLGEAYLRDGDIDRAVRCWQEMGDDPDALFNLGLGYFYRGEFARSVHAFRRGIFENLFLVARLANTEIISNVPRTTGTHTKGLDCEGSAADYLDRCGDLWQGRPILSRWLRAIYEHPQVQEDIARHVEQLRALAREDLSLGERARLEGANTALRSEERLEQADASIAAALCERLFRVST